MITEKQNVQEFNANVLENEGYIYTTNAPLSSILSNKRISDAVNSMISIDVKTIVDVGSGDGTYTEEIARRNPGKQLTGFDPASEAISIAQKKYPGIDFKVGNILETSTFPQKKFDLAVIRGVLHHLSDPELAIKNAGLLADKIIIIEPNGNNPILKYIEKNSAYHRQHEEQSFSSIKLKEWCVKNNLTVNKLDYIGYVPFFFPTFLTRIIYFFQPALEKIYLLRKYFGAQIVIYAQIKDKR